MLRILFIGDISGSPGRRAVASLVDRLRAEMQPDVIIANGENAAGGIGITRKTGIELLDAGIDVLTMGNHTFAKKDAADFITEEPRVIRPANYPAGAPGRGVGVFRTSGGESVAVISLLGRVFMDPMDCPFQTVDASLAGLDDAVKVRLVDMHAEATSEKVAMGFYLDGRVSAVIGTHTHVQTSDDRVLPGGTAYITDAGMTGVPDSVLGLDKDAVIERFVTRLPGKFAIAQGRAFLSGVIVEVDTQTGLAESISRVRIAEDEA